VAISRVPIMAACAPSARAATSPRASPIPPAAAIGIGATASTTRGTNDWLGSNGNNHHLSAGDGNDWIGATGSGGTLDGGSGMTRSWGVGDFYRLFGGDGQAHAADQERYAPDTLRRRAHK